MPLLKGRGLCVDYGRVRALVNDRGKTIQEAGPSMPVEIQGLADLPQAGDSLQVFEDATKARQVAEYRQARLREQSLRATARLSLLAVQARSTLPVLATFAVSFVGVDGGAVSAFDEWHEPLPASVKAPPDSGTNFQS